MKASKIDQFLFIFRYIFGENFCAVCELRGIVRLCWETKLCERSAKKEKVLLFSCWKLSKKMDPVLISTQSAQLEFAGVFFLGGGEFLTKSRQKCSESNRSFGE